MNLLEIEKRRFVYSAVISVIIDTNFDLILSLVAVKLVFDLRMMLGATCHFMHFIFEYVY